MRKTVFREERTGGPIKVEFGNWIYGEGFSWNDHRDSLQPKGAVVRDQE